MTVNKLGEKEKYQRWVGTHPGAIPGISFVFEKTWLLKEVPGVGFEPTWTIRPLELKSNALTTRPSWCGYLDTQDFNV